MKLNVKISFQLQLKKSKRIFVNDHYNKWRTKPIVLIVII